MTDIATYLDFLQHAGFDVGPDKRNIAHLLESGWSNADVAEVFGCSVRTIQRWMRDPHPCPGERCLTMTPGGRYCHFCRRTRAMRSVV